MIDSRRIAVITFPTHRVWIDQQEDGTICCFKSTLTRCDMELFGPGDLDACSDYILASLPQMVYTVTVLGD
jgi:hypothetical protein